ncbi:MAG: NAD(P)H-dependent glycerol-3-phosphate dehydrogenase [Anaerovoracaceae bacterium]
MAKIGVLGAGTWGMALARMLCNMGHEVQVWSALPQEIDQLSTTGVHPKLKNMVIPKALKYTKEIQEVCTDKDILLFAVPSVFVRSTAKQAAEFIKDGQVIVDVAKGIEASTLYTMTEVIRDELDKKGGLANVKLVALSGPTHAEEVAIDLPTTIVSACPDLEVAQYVQEIFMNPKFRVYTNTDIHGVEICGAFKNIIALGTGIARGLGYGDNTAAALITRGVKEMSALGELMGCKPETFNGLAGIGDLIVTCTSLHSRNLTAGMLLGQGKSRDEAVKEVGMVVEGIYALDAAMRLKQKYDVELPICEMVNGIVNEGLSPEIGEMMLMTRMGKQE